MLEEKKNPEGMPIKMMLLKMFWLYVFGYNNYKQIDCFLLTQQSQVKYHNYGKNENKFSRENY